MAVLRIFSTPSCASANIDSMEGKVEVVLVRISAFILLNKLESIPSCFAAPVAV
jgi:hypothetical protein